ncbi:flagellar basal body P-ring protein FlgI [Mariniblastus fucicola]|uniref:flagellar basal body P-ring protein FlgI n=1 Tax=Mariniblastus fucicola TaxID=980251 RepID=UPI0012F994D5|nr:flagellar basal body P-ring protein FlgI [Mariniblastus fucicola]
MKLIPDILIVLCCCFCSVTTASSQVVAPAPAAPRNSYVRGQLDPSVRVKDITFVDGDRNNHVSGDGLVFGLSGTGGKSEQTRSMASSYFLHKGIRVDQAETKNMSAVLVSGKIPPYARKGETILINVSVADDATSLRGGTLHQAVLRGIDDEIYAIAQGPIIGGGVAAGGAAASVTKNHPTVGVCEAIVEREICPEQLLVNGRLRLVLRNKEYSTATQISNALNMVFPNTARALDAGTVEIAVPRSFQRSLPAFISMVGELRIKPDQRARVVINQKTGTIVMGKHVKISRVLFASENIVISTAETPVASQPAPFSQGETVVLPRSAVDIFESGGTYNVWQEGLTVGDLAQALNTLAVSPNSMINIFTTLRNQGALQAELVIE